MARSIDRADELLAKREQQPLPHGVTAHKLRHTFASILVMIGEDPAYVMGQLGHTDPAGPGRHQASRASHSAREPSSPP